jgi:nicotinate-nucleotide pyrophosphorylase (carboxylating)
MIEEIIKQALQEDIGSGDITTEAIVPDSEIICGKFLAKDSGVISGLDIAKKVFKQLDTNIKFNALFSDGASVPGGQVLASIEGNGRAILAGERVALNFLQRMSGIATATRKYVDAAKGTKAVILDTRKTAPGMRILDKKAVRDGGGQNHRFGLYDMFLIKDNHIAAAGSLKNAINLAKKSNGKNLLIEVEVENLDQLKEALFLGVDRIMLDNMETAQIRQAVEITNGRVPLEASGNVNLETIARIAQTGVDYISAGSLTHSVRALDISLEIINQKNND